MLQAKILKCCSLIFLICGFNYQVNSTDQMEVGSDGSSEVPAPSPAPEAVDKGAQDPKPITETGTGEVPAPAPAPEAAIDQSKLDGIIGQYRDKVGKMNIVSFNADALDPHFSDQAEAYLSACFKDINKNTVTLAKLQNVKELLANIILYYNEESQKTLPAKHRLETQPGDLLSLEKLLVKVDALEAEIKNRRFLKVFPKAPSLSQKDQVAKIIRDSKSAVSEALQQHPNAMPQALIAAVKTLITSTSTLKTRTKLSPLSTVKIKPHSKARAFNRALVQSSTDLKKLLRILNRLNIDVINLEVLPKANTVESLLTELKQTRSIEFDIIKLPTFVGKIKTLQSDMRTLTDALNALDSSTKNRFPRKLAQFVKSATALQQYETGILNLSELNQKSVFSLFSETNADLENLAKNKLVTQDLQLLKQISDHISKTVKSKATATEFSFPDHERDFVRSLIKELDYKDKVLTECIVSDTSQDLFGLRKNALEFTYTQDIINSWLNASVLLALVSDATVKTELSLLSTHLAHKIAMINAQATNLTNFLSKNAQSGRTFTSSFEDTDRYARRFVKQVIKGLPIDNSKVHFPTFSFSMTSPLPGSPLRQFADVYNPNLLSEIVRPMRTNAWSGITRGIKNIGSKFAAGIVTAKSRVTSASKVVSPKAMIGFAVLLAFGVLGAVGNGVRKQFFSQPTPAVNTQVAALPSRSVTSGGIVGITILVGIAVLLLFYLVLN